MCCIFCQGRLGVIEAFTRCLFLAGFSPFFVRFSVWEISLVLRETAGVGRVGDLVRVEHETYL